MSSKPKPKPTGKGVSSFATMSGAGRRNKRDESSEVEELLRAAEDETLLNLTVGSHSARSNPLDADIARRFVALKMPSSSSNITKAPLAPKNESSQSIEASVSSLDVDDNLKTILGADLSARFAALKKASSSSSKEFQGQPQKFHDYHVEDDDDDDIDGEGVSKKEVDKVIQWAMDAARLDPSVSSDDDDGDYISDSDDEEEKEKNKKKKKEGSKKKKDQS